MSSYHLLVRLFPPLDDERERHAWVRAQLKKIPKGHKILDAGAGECIYKRYCAHLTYVSQDFCKYDGKGNKAGLQRPWKQENIDIVCDIEHIPVKSKSFDVILCTEVIEHLPHPELAIQEFSRVLRKGGILLLTAPFNSQTHFAPYHYATGFSKYYYEKILPEHGFELVSVTAGGNYWTMQRTEALKYPFMIRKYGKVPYAWILTVPISAMLLIIHTLCNSITANTQEQLCSTFFIKAKKKT